MKLARQFYHAFKAANKGNRGFKDVRVTDSLWVSLAEHPHHWPGNVRELKQVIDSTLFETGGNAGGLDDFLKHLRSDGRVPSGAVLTAVTHPSATLTQREQRIVQFIRDRGKANRGEVETALHLRDTAAWKELKALVGKGLIRRDGSGRGSVYRLGEGGN